MTNTTSPDSSDANGAVLVTGGAGYIASHTVRALRARPEVGSAKVGAVGYCMGGRLAYLAAATAGVDASAPFYGGGIHMQLQRAAVR